MKTANSILLLLALTALVLAGNQYKQDDKIPVYVTKISPFENPSETYNYYLLPFCQPEKVFEESETLGELLAGNRKMNSKYDIFFMKNMTNTLICEKNFTEYEIDAFKKAVENYYLIEMFVDDFDVYDFVGWYKDDRLLLKTLTTFEIGYHPDGNLIYAHVDDTVSEHVDLTEMVPGTTVTFKYSVKFIERSDLPYDNRWLIHDEPRNPEEPEPVNDYDDYAIEIHWISIINSFVLVVLLVGFVSVIIARIVRNDVNTTFDAESGERGAGDEIGWKLIRIEVFQLPNQRNLLCAAVGSGAQIVLLVFIVVIIGCLGLYYGNEGSVKTAGVLLYSFTAIIGGYVAARTYKYLGGSHWALNIITTAILYPIPFFIVWFILNNLAWAEGSTAALPIGTILFIVLLWGLVSFPLTVVGGISGRLRTKDVIADDKLPKAQKPLPMLPWYKRWFVSAFVAGLIPFTAIYLELSYIFKSVWGHKLYTLYGIFLLAFILLILVTACITIALTYFQLNTQDYRWWWRAFINGGSSSFFIFLYSVYFYFNNSHMFGFLQTSFFYGYSFLLSLAVYIGLGAVGFLSSLTFVKYIYSVSKID
eukprot:TRINITY_DN3472_c0_g3_i3.p1 TRINITY_DN3472_c0_g3~~TRINITY_DN3472_c0_g3_i3.p1  ORF type:complete len:590 (-),score=141.94 TRINITY_DN3472_c0_g3_i3:201-1970(-)